MSFVLKKKESYWWPIKVKSPADDGKYDEQELNLHFKKLKVSDLQKKLEGDRKELVKEIVIGWKEVKDEDGKEIPFSTKALENLLNSEYGMLAMIVAGFIESQTGVFEKN
jgi:hypothetical protein